MREELGDGDRRVGDRDVRIRITAQHVLDERLPQRAPVARPIVEHGRGRRERRRLADVEARTEVGALGPEPGRQPRPQRIERDARRRLDDEPVAGRIRQTGELELEVRRRSGRDRGGGDRHRRPSRGLLEAPERRIGERRRRILVEPDLQHPRRPDPRLGGTEPVDAARRVEQPLGPGGGRARRLEGPRLSGQAPPPPASGRPSRAAGR